MLKVKDALTGLFRLGAQVIPPPVLREIRRIYAIGAASIGIGTFFALHFVGRGAARSVLLLPLAVGLYFLVVGRLTHRNASVGVIVGETGTLVEIEKNALRSRHNCILSLDDGTYLKFALQQRKPSPLLGATITVFADRRSQYKDVSGVRKYAAIIAYRISS